MFGGFCHAIVDHERARVSGGYAAAVAAAVVRLRWRCSRGPGGSRVKPGGVLAGRRPARTARGASGPTVLPALLFEALAPLAPRSRGPGRCCAGAVKKAVLCGCGEEHRSRERSERDSPRAPAGRSRVFFMNVFARRVARAVRGASAVSASQANGEERPVSERDPSLQKRSGVAGFEPAIERLGTSRPIR